MKTIHSNLYKFWVLELLKITRFIFIRREDNDRSSDDRFYVFHRCLLSRWHVISSYVTRFLQRSGIIAARPAIVAVSSKMYGRRLNLTAGLYCLAPRTIGTDRCYNANDIGYNGNSSFMQLYLWRQSILRTC